jgi:hypothetical protein
MGSTGPSVVMTRPCSTSKEKLVAKRRITNNAEGLAQLLALLLEAGDSSEDPVPVATQTSRGLLVAALRATGRPVYAINPMAVARYGERHSVSRG